MIELLIWHGRFGDARDLAEKTITDLHEDPGFLLEQKTPFDAAILVGCAETDSDPVSILDRLQTLLPPKSILGKRIAWLLKVLPNKSPYQLVSGSASEPPPREMTDGDTELMARKPTELNSEEQTRLWVAARSCGMPEAFWTMRQLIKVDRVDTASAVLLDAPPTWRGNTPMAVSPRICSASARTCSACSSRFRTRPEW